MNLPKTINVRLARQQSSILYLLDYGVHTTILQARNAFPLGERVNLDDNFPRQVFVSLGLRVESFEIEPILETSKDLWILVFQYDTGRLA